MFSLLNLGMLLATEYSCVQASDYLDPNHIYEEQATEYIRENKVRIRERIEKEMEVSPLIMVAHLS